jgi:hypothetical protein
LNRDHSPLPRFSCFIASRFLQAARKNNGTETLIVRFARNNATPDAQCQPWLTEGFMQNAIYKLGASKGAWGNSHAGSISGEYLTREATLEAAVSAASDAIKKALRSRKAERSEIHELALGAE